MAQVRICLCPTPKASNCLKSSEAVSANSSLFCVAIVRLEFFQGPVESAILLPALRLFGDQDIFDMSVQILLQIAIIFACCSITGSFVKENTAPSGKEITLNFCGG